MLLYCLFPLFLLLFEHWQLQNRSCKAYQFVWKTVDGTKFGGGAKRQQWTKMSVMRRRLVEHTGCVKWRLLHHLESRLGIQSGFSDIPHTQKKPQRISTGQVINIRYLTVPKHTWLLLNTSSSIKQNKIWFSNNLLFVYVSTNYIAIMLQMKAETVQSYKGEVL